MLSNYYFIAVDLKLTRGFFCGADSVVTVSFHFEDVKSSFSLNLISLCY